jgi:hypothetical protein
MFDNPNEGKIFDLLCLGMITICLAKGNSNLFKENIELLFKKDITALKNLV